MQAFLKSLRGLGPLGSFAANILAFLTTNWVVTMTTVISIWAGLSEWANSVVQKAEVQTTIIVFLSLLWTYIGIIYLRDRTKPREVTPAQDYRYGLTYQGLIPIYDPQATIDGAALSMGIQFINYSSGPIRYDVELFDVRVGSRSLPELPKGLLYGYMARGGSRLSAHVGLKKDEIEEFIGKIVKGTARISISYGHPERTPSRRLLMKLDIALELKQDGKCGFSANIIEERDIPFTLLTT